MYKLWKSINTSETEPCVCVKHMFGQIIPQTTTIQKAVIDDIINAVDGFEGADYWLQKYGILPDKYIGKKEAKALGWVSVLGNLDEVAPGMMIGGDIYRNRNGHLPQADGRIWYEADINYTGGYRSRHRILYSNDGLIFVTYDHYETFVEIV